MYLISSWLSRDKRWKKRGSDCRRTDRKRLSGNMKVTLPVLVHYKLPECMWRFIMVSLTVLEVRYDVSKCVLDP